MPGAAGGDERADFLVGEHLVEAGLLGVDEFAAQRKDRLKRPIAALLGGSRRRSRPRRCRVHGERGSRSEQSASFPGSPPPESAPFADGFPGLAARLAGAGGVERLVDDALCDGGFVSKYIIRPSYETEPTMLSTSGERSFTFVCDSKLRVAVLD
jgi:hypothetical protein